MEERRLKVVKQEERHVKRFLGLLYFLPTFYSRSEKTHR